MVTSLSENRVSAIANPYWKYSSLKPTKVTYYNLNTKLTTLDEGRRDAYDQLGPKSPMRYNRIKDFILYGLPRFQVDLSLEEDGVQSAELGGTGVILPKTIIPHVDDYFTIDYIKKPYLFRVTSQTIDSIEHDAGVNFYRIQAVLDNTRQDFLKALNGRQLAYKYVFKIDRVGTNMSPVLTEEEDAAIGRLQQVYETLRARYVELFWRSNVQTFICAYLDGMYLYDPYLVEFMVRNGLFDSDDELKYLYVDQAVHHSSTFQIEYDHTIFRSFERRSPKLPNNSMYPVPVHDPNSMLVDRMEDYVELSNHLIHSNQKPINQLNLNLFDHIVEDTPFDEEDTSNHVLYWNMLVGWINDGDDYEVTAAQLDSLEKLSYRYSKDLFYEIPLLMFVLQSYMAKLAGEEDSEEAISNATTYLEQCYNVKQ